jgi:hypothetical protein
MLKLYYATIAIALVALGGVGLAPQAPGQEAKDKGFTATTTRVWNPTRGHWMHFIHRDKLRGVKPADARTFNRPLDSFSAPALPIDWAKSLAFKTYGNDREGDCYEAALGHADNTMTGNVGTESDFALTALLTQYHKWSGGDNGLSDSDAFGIWKEGIAGDKNAVMIDYLMIDVTNPIVLQACMWKYGPVMYTFDVADSWINNSADGDVWDAPAADNPSNGHAIIFNGVRLNGDVAAQTWGNRVWMTEKARTICQPSGWVAISPRWFNAKGYAPNKLHVTQLAAEWVKDGGKALPAAFVTSYPPPGDPPPPPPPGPLGNLPTVTVSGDLKAGTYQLVPLGSETVPAGTTAKLKELMDLLSPPKKAPLKAIVPKKTSKATVVPGDDDLRHDLDRLCLPASLSPVNPEIRRRLMAWDRLQAFQP